MIFSLLYFTCDFSLGWRWLNLICFSFRFLYSSFTSPELMSYLVIVEGMSELNGSLASWTFTAPIFDTSGYIQGAGGTGAHRSHSPRCCRSDTCLFAVAACLPLIFSGGVSAVSKSCGLFQGSRRTQSSCLFCFLLALPASAVRLALTLLG